MTKRHRRQGEYAGISYSFDQSAIDEAKSDHGIDLIAEIESAIKKELENNPELLKEVNESKRT